MAPKRSSGKSLESTSDKVSHVTSETTLYSETVSDKATKTTINKETLDVIALEAQLLEQEHRFISCIMNFVNRSRWGKDDPRRRATIISLLWRLFPFTSASSVGIGLVGIITLVLAYEANIKLENQNALIIIQNELSEAQRRSSLNIELSAIMNTIETQLADKERENVDKPDDFKRGHKPAVYAINDITESRIIAISQSLKPYRALTNYGERNYASSVSELLSLSRFDSDNFFTDSVDINSFLEDEYLSPERGQLLVAISKSRIIFEGVGGIGQLSMFDSADLRRANLRRADIRQAQMDQSNLNEAQLDYAIFDSAQLQSAQFIEARGTHTRFRNARIPRADFSRAIFFSANFSETYSLDTTFTKTQLIQANFAGAMLKGVSFEGANLDGASFANVIAPFDIRNIKGALITNLQDAPEGFVEWAITQGATLDRDAYIDQLKAEDPEYFFLVSQHTGSGST
ncbi:hypothetical protein C7Y69_00810 [Alteromonas sp. KS69]|jgi:uncharacterized protein YjbI with pentapeptide repeats|uniref:pentapeptide repeat-containing protein n=1 Tax=Alteromonas sp. KS69 TaxID=2109917 RepID=UPI000F869658|nr:pentapeptide repeat-containing protein [Alteromonas sp. KS69]RUP83565.1 hypothetical protein C7Y69_00810 [Alteromonas sp. KS69]